MTDAPQIPVCPVCGEPLEMLRRYLWAPSIAMCARGHLCDAEYDHDLGEWVATLSDSSPGTAA